MPPSSGAGHRHRDDIDLIDATVRGDYTQIYWCPLLKLGDRGRSYTLDVLDIRTPGVKSTRLLKEGELLHVLGQSLRVPSREHLC